MLVDNSYDALMGNMGPAQRPAMRTLPTVPAPQFEDGRTTPGLLAEHGFSALVRIRRGEREHTLLFDTGISPDGMAINLERLELDAGAIEAVVLSHGHFDHAGGFAGLARLRRIVEPTVAALAAMAPELIVPAHCTGWKAQLRLAAALPDAFVPNAVGTSFVLAAAVG